MLYYTLEMRFFTPYAQSQLVFRGKCIYLFMHLFIFWLFVFALLQMD